jgi:hypothetical protein
MMLEIQGIMEMRRGFKRGSGRVGMGIDSQKIGDQVRELGK